jgi:hypothetical protein
LAEVSAYTTPRAMIGAPPSEVTLPPKVAVVLAMLVYVGAVTTGADVAGIKVENLPTAEYEVSTLFVA